MSWTICWKMRAYLRRHVYVLSFCLGHLVALGSHIFGIYIVLLLYNWSQAHILIDNFLTVLETNQVCGSVSPIFVPNGCKLGWFNYRGRVWVHLLTFPFDSAWMLDWACIDRYRDITIGLLGNFSLAYSLPNACLGVASSKEWATSPAIATDCQGLALLLNWAINDVDVGSIIVVLRPLLVRLYMVVSLFSLLNQHSRLLLIGLRETVLGSLAYDTATFYKHILIARIIFHIWKRSQLLSWAARTQTSIECTSILGSNVIQIDPWICSVFIKIAILFWLWVVYWHLEGCLVISWA